MAPVTPWDLIKSIKVTGTMHSDGIIDLEPQPPKVVDLFDPPLVPKARVIFETEYRGEPYHLVEQPAPKSLKHYFVYRNWKLLDKRPSPTPKPLLARLRTLELMERKSFERYKAHTDTFGMF